MSRTLEELRHAVLGTEPARQRGSATPTSKWQPILTPYNTHDLQHKHFEPLVYIVDSLITIGLLLLAGPPKVGKSYLILGLLFAIAKGGMALGSIRVQKADVLYLALEDNERRVRFRLSHLTEDGETWPDNFHVVHSAPKLDEGLIEALEAWLDAHPRCRIAVLDTLARVRPERNRAEDAYTADSRLMEGLQEVAIRREIAIIVVHHVRKAPGLDVFETVSGTYGLTGPADTVMILQRVRGEADATLHVTGRDVEEREVALSFEAHAGTWKILGDARIYAQSTERRTILETVDAKPGLKPKQIADATGLKYGSVKHLMLRLRDEAKVSSDDAGRYYPVHPVHQTLGMPSSTQGER